MSVPQVLEHRAHTVRCCATPPIRRAHRACASSHTVTVQSRSSARNSRANALTVQRVQAGDSVNGCHVLRLSRLDLKDRQALLDTLEGAPVLLSLSHIVEDAPSGTHR